MAVIKARIKSDGFDCNVRIVGDGKIEQITCDDDFALYVIKKDIKQAVGRLANNYHPLPNTMLQAFATVSRYSDEVDVEGDIGEIPYDKGVVY